MKISLGEWVVVRSVDEDDFVYVERGMLEWVGMFERGRRAVGLGGGLLCARWSSCMGAELCSGEGDGFDGD